MTELYFFFLLFFVKLLYNKVYQKWGVLDRLVFWNIWYGFLKENTR